MAFSIRTRLTFWYVTLLTVSLIGFGAAFSYSLLKIYMYRTDNQISSVANMMVHTVVKPSGQMFLPRDFDIILERFFGIRTAGNYIQVLDPLGQTVARSSNLESMKLPITRDTYHAAVNGATTFEIIRNVGRYPVRVVTKPIFVPDKGLVAIVQVGSSLEEVDEVFHSLAYIFMLGVAASVVIASAVGWFLAKKALKPVSEITKLARKIGREPERAHNDRVPNDEGRSPPPSTRCSAGSKILPDKAVHRRRSHELKTPLTILKGEME